jgi:hypothetical protein
VRTALSPLGTRQQRTVKRAVCAGGNRPAQATISGLGFIPVWLESKQAPLKLSCDGELVSWVSLLESASLARCSRLCVTIAV